MSTPNALDLEQDDTALEAQFKTEFAALHDSQEHIRLEFSPLDAWCILSAIQLASRHPAVQQSLVLKIAKRFALQLQARVAKDGALAIVAKRGWDSQYDEEASK